METLISERQSIASLDEVNDGSRIDRSERRAYRMSCIPLSTEKPTDSGRWGVRGSHLIVRVARGGGEVGSVMLVTAVVVSRLSRAEALEGVSRRGRGVLIARGRLLALLSAVEERSQGIINSGHGTPLLQ